MTRVAAKRPLREALGFALPLLALLSIGALGLWRERMAGLAEQDRQLAWLANTAAEQAAALLAREESAWAWAETQVARDGTPTGPVWFPEAPLPQAEGDASKLLAAGRFDEVIARFPGMLSPAGLPLGPVAAYRKLNAAPDTGAALDAARQLHELAFAYPSLLTPQLLAAAEADLERLGVTDPAATPWRVRWATLDHLAGALNRLLEQPLPSTRKQVWLDEGEAWWLEAKPEGDATTVRVFPLTQWLAATQTAWRKLPVAEGARLALTAGERDLVPLPTDAADWPQAAVAIGGGAMRVVAMRDPAVVARTTRARIFLLGGVGLLAGAAMTAAWWRQKRAMRLQADLVRQKDDFLSTVSHELRTPVAAMQLLSENLVTGTVTEPEATARYHRQLLQESRRLAATTAHLLDFALMERGHKSYQFAPLELPKLADEVRSVLAPLAGARGIGLKIAVEPVEPPPLGDAEGVRRLILNLGDNAIKFSPSGTEVNIRLGPAVTGTWLIRVTDQGPGIPPVEQSRIFERFFRGGQVLDRSTRGTGIGLAVARHVAGGHGGTVALTESSAAGSTFTCVLPCQPPGSNDTHENPAD
jgi:signal transduction histidine kinase